MNFKSNIQDLRNLKISIINDAMPAYNPKSEHAEEFICDEEIRETLEYAARNKSNRGLIESILNKAAGMKGLNHREAAVLMDCDLPEMNERIHDLAREIKKAFYGNRIVLFAPLYLSNHCVNGCVYCPYHGKNKSIPRKKLSMEEIAAEVRALENMGHKRRSNAENIRSTILLNMCSMP